MRSQVLSDERVRLRPWSVWGHVVEVEASGLIDRLYGIVGGTGKEKLDSKGPRAEGNRAAEQDEGWGQTGGSQGRVPGRRTPREGQRALQDGLSASQRRKQRRLGVSHPGAQGNRGAH